MDKDTAREYFGIVTAKLSSAYEVFNFFEKRLGKVNSAVIDCRLSIIKDHEKQFNYAQECYIESGCQKEDMENI